MIIAIGSDHAGFKLKSQVASMLKTRGFEVMDLGATSTDSVDYPVYGKLVGEAVASGKAERGVVVCGSGIGISIAANRIKGARAANCTTEYAAELARLHNDANVLALGERVVTSIVAERILDVFLNTVFEGGRHQRRVSLLDTDEGKPSDE